MGSRRTFLYSEEVELKTNGVVNEVIQDSIRQVVINCKAGRASEYYSVGDRINITLEGIDASVYLMFLGSGLDTRADGSDKPVSTWAFQSSSSYLYSTWNENGSTELGWEKSTLRNFLRTTVYDALPDIIKNNIVEVKKLSNGSITIENVWVPSREELFGSAYTYSDAFPDDKSRRKLSNSWLRSIYTNTYAYMVNSNGLLSGDKAEYEKLTQPCLCL